MWGSTTYEAEMQNWIKSRINTFPNCYQHKDQSTLILQAAADLFFANVEVYTSDDETPNYILVPRQLINLNIK